MSAGWVHFGPGGSESILLHTTEDQVFKQSALYTIYFFEIQILLQVYRMIQGIYAIK